MSTNSLKQNFTFQLIYQLLIFAIPFVVSPYLTRTLGGDALGVYTYANSIAYYFILFINLGINKHGQRIIAANKDDDTLLRKAFWSLFSFHSLVSALGIIAYILFCLFLCKDNRHIFIIETLYVLSAFVDITWLFYGLENFKSVAIKNTIIKLLECILIFCFVKSPKDLAEYTFITAGGMLLGQLIMLPQAFKTVKPIKFSWPDLMPQIKPMLVLFVSVIASSLYTVFDKTLLGMLSPNIEDVAFYEYSNKIITIPKVIIAVIGTVIFPRACQYASAHNERGQHRIMLFSGFATSILGSGCMFGLAAIANKLAIVYYGEDFSICGKIIVLMTPLILIVSLGDTFRSGYLIPSHKDNIYVISNIASAAINLIISYVLILKIGVLGAVYGTLVAEILGFIIQAYACRHVFNLKDILKIICPSLVVGFIMYLIVAYLDKSTNNTFVWLAIEVIIGIAIYCIVIILMAIIFFKDTFYDFIHKYIAKKNKI